MFAERILILDGAMGRMIQAVGILDSILEASSDGNGRAREKVLLATVKEDIHGIGKNIVGVVLWLQKSLCDRP